MIKLFRKISNFQMELINDLLLKLRDKVTEEKDSKVFKEVTNQAKTKKKM